MLPIDLASKFDLIDDHWHPRVVASLNGQDVKIAKVQGDFVWHAHDDEDELTWETLEKLVEDVPVLIVKYVQEDGHHQPAVVQSKMRKRRRRLV